MGFSGINVAPSVYAPIQSLDAPGGPITGMLERIPYDEIFRLGKRLFPRKGIARGQTIAKKLCINHIDSDQEILKFENSTINDIFLISFFKLL